MTLHRQQVFRGAFFAFILTFVSAGSAAASKHVSGSVSVAVIVLIQYLICCIGMIPWLTQCSLDNFKTQRWLEHLIRGITGWACFYTFYAILQPSGVTISWWHLVGMVSGITLAGSMVATRVLSSTEDTSLILFYYFAISLLCSLPAGITQWQPIPLSAWSYLIGIGLSIYSAMWLYTKSLTYARASVIAPIGYFAVVNSGFLGWLLWDHTPELKTATGIVLVISAGLLAIYIGARDERKALLASSQ